MKVVNKNVYQLTVGFLGCDKVVSSEDEGDIFVKQTSLKSVKSHENTTDIFVSARTLHLRYVGYHLLQYSVALLVAHRLQLHM
jgi:galactitol-specific phosphotransferase system IIB component